MLNNQFALMTPEGVSLILLPAGPSRRALAYAVDFLIWFFTMFSVAMLLTAVLGQGKLKQGFWLIFLFLSYWGYPILFEVYGGGKTLGKRIFDLEVLRHDGLPVGWRESVLRNLMLVVDFMPMMYAAGLLCTLFDTRFRRLGDIVANTQVVHRQQIKRKAIHFNETPEALPFQLSANEQRALIDFVERADQLSSARRLELADLAEPLTNAKGEASLHRLRAFVAGLVQ